MPFSAATSLIAVDVGNSRIKLGRFELLTGLSLPEPVEVFDLPLADNRSGSFDAARLEAWCQEHVANGMAWRVASVHRPAAERLTSMVADWAARSHIDCPLQCLTYADVPLAIRVAEPPRVGIDRLLGALAADRLRWPDRPAVIIDLGTAITVDLLEADGSFSGGAILPGIAMAARALAEQTDALPDIGLDRLETPPVAVGKSTTSAIESGLYWGAVGAIRELLSQMSSGLAMPPDVFLTGGASSQVAERLTTDSDRPVRHVPHLVLSGIALAAESLGKAGG